MLISKEIEVKLYGKKIKHYKELGYKIPTHKTKDGYIVKGGTIITIKIEDLPKGSHELVLVQCDYCGKKYPTRYDGYIKRKENDINLDCCDECKSIKNKELNILRYGVENQFQREEIRDKAMFIKSKNNLIVYSNQQKYLHNLLGGELNYCDKTTKGYSLDIAFPDMKVLIEYNGTGHNLQVKFGNITEEEFKLKEIQRYCILKYNGWKQIKIESKRDYLPSDDMLKEEFSKALEWLKSDDKGHWHYNIYFGNINDRKYGRLRTITENDLDREIS